MALNHMEHKEREREDLCIQQLTASPPCQPPPSSPACESLTGQYSQTELDVFLFNTVQFAAKSLPRTKTLSHYLGHFLLEEREIITPAVNRGR